MKNLLLIPIFFFASCQSSGSKEEVDLKALKDEVFEIHDEVMPLMGDLRRVRKAIMLQADSIGAVDSTRAVVLTAASDNLEQANEGMMEWMRNFDPNFEGTDEEVLNYLNGQKESIEKVNKSMKEALKEGEELIAGS